MNVRKVMSRAERVRRKDEASKLKIAKKRTKTVSNLVASKVQTPSEMMKPVKEEKYDPVKAMKLA